MSKQLTVKKSNSLIGASYTITLAEQRMILLAIATAGGTADVPLRVDAAAYADHFKVSRSTAYESLREAAAQLFERRFTFQEETAKGSKTTVSRWVSHVSYAEGNGYVELMFSPHVQPLLCELERKFTYYGLEQVASLTSVHAVRLYELLISWRSTGKTPIYELEDFRRKLGVEPEEYTRMNNFKARVLDSAIAQINEHTDITVSYQQHKKGRAITGFSFTFTAKNERDPHTIDLLTGQTDAESTHKPLSDKQREYFGDLLSQQPSMAKHSQPKWSYAEFGKWITGELEKPSRVNEWMPNLLAAGFKQQIN